MGEEFLSLNRSTVDQVFDLVHSEAKKKLPGAVRTPGMLPRNRNQFHALLSVAYWVSHERNEARTLRFSLLLIPHASAAEETHVITFLNPVPLNKDTLTQLAPISSGAFGIAVAVNAASEWEVWGLVVAPRPCMAIKVAEPGVLLVRLDFETVAFVEHDKCFVAGAGASEVARIVAHGFSGTLKEPHRVVLGALLLQIAGAMRQHGNGGTLLVVSSQDATWEHHVSLTRRFESFPSLSRKMETYIEEIEAHLDDFVDRSGFVGAYPSWQALPVVSDLYRYLACDYSGVSAELRRIVEAIGGLTAVDGATIVNDQLDLIGFGAILNAPRWSDDITRWTAPSIIANRDPVSMSMGSVSGTRHRSAIDFVAASRESVALVVSHDGPVSLVTWYDAPNTVLLFQRLELLLDRPQGAS